MDPSRAEESYEKVLRSIPEETNLTVLLLCLARYQWLRLKPLVVLFPLVPDVKPPACVKVLLSRAACPYVQGKLVTDGKSDIKCSQILLKSVG